MYICLFHVYAKFTPALVHIFSPYVFRKSIFPPGEGHHAHRRDTSHAGRGDGGRGLQRGTAAWQRGTLAGAGRDADGADGEICWIYQQNASKCKR